MKQISISTQSQDLFKWAFINTISQKANLEVCKISRFWQIKKVQSLFAHIRYHVSFKQSKNTCKLVPTNGALLVHESLPYCFNEEIVPFLWDCWPGNWDKLVYSLILLRVKLCFVTSKQVQDMLKTTIPSLHCIYIPEAVNNDRFTKGGPLVGRTNKVFEVGRKHPIYHKILGDYFRDEKGIISDYVEDFENTLSNTQISISFPRCDTNPEMACEVETLTERYWESMFSRCLIVGRAPKELIDLIGYNPVIDVDWKDPQKQLGDILANIDCYQELVDKNYKVACEKGTWSSRLPIIKEALCSLI